MFISVLGSWGNKNVAQWSLRNQAAFIYACKSIGAAIQKTGNFLVVDEEASRNTATWYAFQGLCEALNTSNEAEPVRPCVVLIDHYPDGSKYQAALSNFRNALLTMESGLDGRERRRTFQLLLSKAIVLLGGANSTYSQGKVALAALPDRLTCVGAFGGAAEKLLGDQMLKASEIEKGKLAAFSTGSWIPMLQNRLLESLGLKDKRTFFIIHGRGGDEYKLKSILQNECALPEPIIMKEEHNVGLLTVPEKLEGLANDVYAAIAIVSADDVGGLIGSDQLTEFACRARQNVWLEVGWFWGRLGRKRVLLLCKGDTEIPSDLSGIMIDRYQSDIGVCLPKIQAFIREISGENEENKQAMSIVTPRNVVKSINRRA